MCLESSEPGFGSSYKESEEVREERISRVFKETCEYFKNRKWNPVTKKTIKRN